MTNHLAQRLVSNSLMALQVVTRFFRSPENGGGDRKTLIPRIRIWASKHTHPNCSVSVYPYYVQRQNHTPLLCVIRLGYQLKTFQQIAQNIKHHILELAKCLQYKDVMHHLSLTPICNFDIYITVWEGETKWYLFYSALQFNYI